jgi:hypothetical protein
MKFTHVSFNPDLNYDKDYFNTAIQLQNAGASFYAIHSPELQTIYEGGKNKQLTIAFLILRWTYKIDDRENKNILNYTVEDKYQFNPGDYALEDVREVVANSFDSIVTDFRESSIEGIYLDDIPEPEQNEFENLCIAVLQFLKSKTK